MERKHGEKAKQRIDQPGITDMTQCYYEPS